MIIGIGTDLIEISRIKEALKKFSRFEEKIFTAFEREYARKAVEPAARYAKRFAAKEAFLKAIGTGLSQEISWQDIEVRNSPHGQPELYLRQTVYSFLKQKFGAHHFTVHLSLTDTAYLAQAFVIIDMECKNEL